jgi:hypothetical protein
LIGITNLLFNLFIVFSVIVVVPESDGKQIWKYTNGGIYKDKKEQTIITFVCAGCRSLYDQKEIRLV